MATEETIAETKNEFLCKVQDENRAFEDLRGSKWNKYKSSQPKYIINLQMIEQKW